MRLVNVLVSICWTKLAGVVYSIVPLQLYLIVTLSLVIRGRWLLPWQVGQIAVKRPQNDGSISSYRSRSTVHARIVYHSDVVAAARDCLRPSFPPTPVIMSRGGQCHTIDMCARSERIVQISVRRPPTIPQTDLLTFKYKIGLTCT